MSDREESAHGQATQESPAERLKALKAKYGPKTAIFFDEDLGEIVVAARGKKAAFKRFAEESQDKKFVFETACEEFVRAVAIEVNGSTDGIRTKLDQMFEDAAWAGVEIALKAKKLFEGDFVQLGKD